jgi:threonine dehydrogenase-like Zn-dependent dehydrogenase
MKAVVYHGVGDIRLDDVPEPKLEAPTDAIVRLTASAICGTDLHFVRGTMPGTTEGRILGHEGVGVVDEIGGHFPIGNAFIKNLTLTMGNCNHRKYIPRLVELVRTGAVDPTALIAKQEPIGSAIDAYESFDRRRPGWLKVELQPVGAKT